MYYKIKFESENIIILLNFYSLTHCNFLLKYPNESFFSHPIKCDYNEYLEYKKLLNFFTSRKSIECSINSINENYSKYIDYIEKNKIDINSSFKDEIYDKIFMDLYEEIFFFVATCEDATIKKIESIKKNEECPICYETTQCHMCYTNKHPMFCDTCLKKLNVLSCPICNI